MKKMILIGIGIISLLMLSGCQPQADTNNVISTTDEDKILSLEYGGQKAEKTEANIYFLFGEIGIHYPNRCTTEVIGDILHSTRDTTSWFKEQIIVKAIIPVEYTTTGKTFTYYSFCSGNNNLIELNSLPYEDAAYINYVYESLR